MAIVNVENKIDFMRLTACGGSAEVIKQHDSQTTGRMWGSTTLTIEFKKCQKGGPCADATQGMDGKTSIPGCLLHMTMTAGGEPAMVNYILWISIFPMCECPYGAARWPARLRVCH